MAAGIISRVLTALAVGLAVMVGQVPAMWNVLASDAVAHLCKHRPFPETIITIIGT
jgi:hypothetical protein